MAYIVTSFTTCPADCDDANVLPAILAEQDCPSYEQVHSQIHTLYLRPSGAADPFTNFATTPTATANAIDNTAGDNTKSIELVGEGGIAVPEKVILDYPKLQQRTVERDYPLTFNVKNLSAAQYAFLLQLQCGHTEGLTFYYASGMGATQWLYGIQGGIPVYYIDVDFPKDISKDGRDIATITIRFKAAGDPARRVNPLG
jgi:hypothetical protein